MSGTWCARAGAGARVSHSGTSCPRTRRPLLRPRSGLKPPISSSKSRRTAILAPSGTLRRLHRRTARGRGPDRDRAPQIAAREIQPAGGSTARSDGRARPRKTLPCRGGGVARGGPAIPVRHGRHVGHRHDVPGGRGDPHSARSIVPDGIRRHIAGARESPPRAARRRRVWCRSNCYRRRAHPIGEAQASAARRLASVSSSRAARL